MKADDTGARIVDKRKNWEARVEMAIFKLPKSVLSTYDKLVYAILCGHSNRDGNAMLYVRTIAEEASCSERQTRRALSNLEARRLLIRRPQNVQGQGQTFNVYEIYGFDEYKSSGTYKYRKECVQANNSQANAGQKPGWRSGENQPENPMSDSHTLPDKAEPRPVRHIPPACPAELNNVFQQPLKNIKENTPPFPPGGQGVEGGEKTPEEKRHDTEAGAKGTKTPEAEFFEMIRDAYNTALPELPKAERVTASRAGILRRRIEEDSVRRKLSWWKRFFGRVREFPWPMGDNPNNWQADFDWLIGEKGMQKIIEGGFRRPYCPGEATRAGLAIQKKYTDQEGRIDARAILREARAAQARG
jgi:hypothetical protein